MMKPINLLSSLRSSDNKTKDNCEHCLNSLERKRRLLFQRPQQSQEKGVKEEEYEQERVFTMKPINLLSSLRSSGNELKDNCKHRLGALERKGRMLFQRPQQSQEKVIKKEEREQERVVLRTFVIVEQTLEPEAHVVAEEEEEKRYGNASLHVAEPTAAVPKNGEHHGIRNRFVARMLIHGEDETRSSPALPPPANAESNTSICVASPGSDSSWMDRRRSNGTNGISKNSESEETNSFDAMESAVVIYHENNKNDNRDHNKSHEDAEDASTVVISNQSHKVACMICSIPDGTTLREMRAWRNAASDLFFL